MNERIRELAEQAKIDYELLPEVAREPVWIAIDDELEKFAELIVRECALTAGLMEQANRPNIGAGILDSFGVEP
jgi:HD-like signal output (HDOD) protein